MPPEFADWFSSTAAGYAAFRPRYPDGLFDWLAAHAPAGIVWEAGAGSGQASIALAERFPRVIATDASEAQLAAAPRHPRIDYRRSSADSSGLPDASVSLVAVAQALHWFPLDAFFLEVRRVLVPGGLLAVWSYGDAALDVPALNDAWRDFHYGLLGAWWPHERRLVGAALRDIPLPFEELEVPEFPMVAEWTLAELVGYAGSWSAVTRWRQVRGNDPLPLLVDALAPLWGEPGRRRTVRWPLVVRAARRS